MNSTVFIGSTGYSEYCGEGLRILKDYGCEIIENTKGRPYTAEELLEIAPSLDGAIAGVETWDEAAFSAAPKLKALARFGVGCDNIDLESAKRHGVKVANCPGLNSNSVAEHTLAMLLALLRQVPQLNSSVRRGEWRRMVFPELRGRTVGLLGFGSIGRRMAHVLSGFDVELLAYDKFPSREAAEKLGVTLLGFDEVISRSDFITVHLPSTPETARCIDRESLSKMKDGVFIINTARGILADEGAVCEALASGKLGGYASDVYEKEPIMPDNPLLAFDNYICSPHLAGESLVSYRDTGLLTAKNIVAVLSGGEPDNRLV